MNVLNPERVRDLIHHRAPCCVSIFMSAHRAGREQQQDVIRLKNLVREAEEAVRERTGSAATAEEVLRPVNALRWDDLFWRRRSEGLACFCAEGFFRLFQVPFALEEQWTVSDRFSIRPLLPLMRNNARLFILALTQESARLYESSEYSIREIPLPEVAPLERDGDEQALQFHSHRSPAQGRGASDEARFHGQGGPADRTKKDTLRFFQRVDRAVRHVLQGNRAPLVLACVGYLAPLYEEANRYRQLIKGKVPGSPDRWSTNELRDHAWKLAEPHLRRRQREAWRSFERVKGQNGGSDDLRTIVLAADQGRVDTLFLARGEKRWGRVEPGLRAVHLVEDRRDGQELLDYAAVKTLGNGGDVYLLETLPDTDAPAAAKFRY